MATANAAATTSAAPVSAKVSATPKPEPAAPWYVIDSTATPKDERVYGSGPRTHEQIVDGVHMPFTFEYGKPLAMPEKIARKFLKHDAWKLTDASGTVLPFQRPPKQPHEAQAGEQFKLADNECVARYDELSNEALKTRVLEMPGGEKFADAAPSRKAVIEFIVQTKLAIAKANTSKVPDTGKDDFVPEPELDEEGAA